MTPDENQQIDGSSIKLFLSYAREDGQMLARKLKEDLEALNLDVWMDVSSIEVGDDWRRTIEDGIRDAHIVIFLMSPCYVRRRDDQPNVCLQELSFARSQKPAKPIIPVMIKQCEMPLDVNVEHYVDMCRWSDSDEQYNKGLAEIIEAIRNKSTGDRMPELNVDFLNPIDFRSYTRRLLRKFCGRDWVWDEINAWATSSTDKGFVIRGIPGAGKSSILAHLAHTNRGNRVLATHFCRADTPETYRPARFVRSLAASIAQNVPEYAAQLTQQSVINALSEEQCQQDPASSLHDGVISPLTSLKSRHVDEFGFVLIDALDEALDFVGAPNIVDLLRQRLEDFPDWVKLVVTSRYEPKIDEWIGGLRGLRLEDAEPSRKNESDVKLFINRQLKVPNLQAKLARSEWDSSSATNELWKRSAGNFLYIYSALEGLERDLCHFDELDKLPPGLPNLYSAFFHRKFPEGVNFETPRRVLTVMVSAREPLAEEVLSDATGLNAADLANALRTLREYLVVVRRPKRQPQFRLFHTSLADWLTSPAQRGSSFYIDRLEGHRRLADAGWHQFQKLRISKYALNHLPHHLIATGRLKDVGVLLSNDSFVEARSSRGMVKLIINDIERMKEAIQQNDSNGTTMVVDKALNAAAKALEQRGMYYEDLVDIFEQSKWLRLVKELAQIMQSRPESSNIVKKQFLDAEAVKDAIPRDEFKKTSVEGSLLSKRTITPLITDPQTVAEIDVPEEEREREEQRLQNNPNFQKTVQELRRETS